MSIHLIGDDVGVYLRSLSVLVDDSCTWKEAINAAGPNTDDKWDICKVGKLYKPEKGLPRVREIVIANFARILCTPEVIKLATQFKLMPEKPRSVFAIAKQFPSLHEMLGLESMGLISPVPCNFKHGQYMPLAWWDGPKRGTDLYLFEKALGTSF